MESFFIVLAFIFILLLWRKNTKILFRLHELEEMYKKLEREYRAVSRPVQEEIVLETKPKKEKFEREIEKPIILPDTSVLPEEKIENPPLEEKDTSQEEEKIPDEISPPVKKSIFPNWQEKWKKIEQPLVENWTGILGAMILVMGVGFLGIYAAFIVSPFFRFLMVLGVSGALYGISIYIKNKPSFLTFHTYLLSASGAVFLIATVGSFGIEGLKWTENLFLSIILLIIGVGVNTKIGIQTGKENFVSLHTVLGLVAISYLDNSFFAYAIGSMAILISLYKNLREKWDWHLLWSLVSFFVFAILQLTKNNTIIENYFYRYISILLTVSSLGFFLFIHYKNVFYEKKKLELLPFLSHLLSWSFLGILLLKLSTGGIISTVLLGLSSGIVFFLSKKAKEKEISWLFLSDKLVSLTIAYLFAISFSKLEISGFMILVICGIETWGFSFLVFKEKSLALLRVGLTISSIFATFLFLMVALNTGELGKETIRNLISYSVFLLFALVLYPSFRTNRQKEYLEDSISPLFLEIGGFFLGLGGIAIYAHLYKIENISTYGSFVSIGFLIWQYKRQGLGVWIGLFSSIVLFFITHWIISTENHSSEVVLLSLFKQYIPLFVLSIAISFLSFVEEMQKKLSYIGIYLFAIHSVLFTLLVSTPNYFYLVGPSLAILSILYLHLGLFTKRKDPVKLEFYSWPEEHILFSAFGVLLTSILRNFLFEDDIQHKWSTIPIPYLSKAGFLAVLGIWIWQSKNLVGTFQKTIYPFVYELVLVILLFSTGYLPDIWGIVSFFLMMNLTILVGKFFSHLNRFQFYSYVLFLFSSLLLFQFGLKISRFAENDLSAMISIVLLYTLYLIKGFDWLAWKETYPILFRPIEKLFGFITHHNETIYRFLGIYLGTAILLFFLSKLLSLGSNLSVGVVWLGFSILFLEVSSKTNNRIISAIYKEVGILILPIFLFRHLFVDLQTNAYLGIIPIRFLIELLTIGVLFYWYLYGKEEKTEGKIQITSLLEYFVEGILLFVFLALESIVPNFAPLSWSMLCFGLFYLGNKYSSLTRLIIYSSYLHIFVMFYLAFGLAGSSNPSSFWLSQNWFIGIVTIFVQTFYIYRIYNEFGSKEYEYPTVLRPVQTITNKLIEKKDFYLFYPFFFSIFFFLYWSFENALLTLLWTILSFVIFSLSIILRLSHFRFTALALILFCVLRLIFHDLSSSGTITKAIVFLGVGSILLLMNSLYNKFKDRF